MKHIVVLEDYQGLVESLPQWRRLDGRAEVTAFRDRVEDPAALADRLRGYHIVVPIRERTRFDRSVIERLRGVEYLCLTGKNSGHVDVAAATSRGILVSETEGSGEAAVEMSFALLLALVRGIPQQDRNVREGGWGVGAGTQLSGSTLGILGLGRIGTRMAQFGHLVGMRVIAWGPTLTDERAAAAGVTRVAIDRLFRESDVISVHLRLSPTTQGVVTADLLRSMKPTAFLVNTARGPLIVEHALIDVLRERRIAGAALDVYDEEPLPRDHPLRQMDNVVLSPHMGFVTRQSYDLFFSQAIENIDRYLAGELPNRTLNPEVRHGVRNGVRS